MSNAKHTPGPWRKSTDNSVRMHITQPDGMPIADVHGRLGMNSTDSAAIRNANAALIAAAPDVTAALKNIHNGLETGAIKVTTDMDEVWDDALRKMDAALKKAGAI